MSICNAKNIVCFFGLKILIFKTFELQIRMDEETIGRKNFCFSLFVHVSRFCPVGTKYRKKNNVPLLLRAVRYAIIYRTHFVPDGTIHTETFLFYRYFVPKGTFFSRRHLLLFDSLIGVSQ